MKKYLIIILLLCFSCKNKENSKTTDNNFSNNDSTIIKYREDGSKSYEVKSLNGKKEGDAFYFDKTNNIIGFEEFVNDKKNGFSLLLNETTKKPKYLVEYNDDVKDGVLIIFNEDGAIKSFRSSDLYNDSRFIKFYENGRIKEFGKTKKGKADGIWYYFDENGKLKEKVLYENGQVVN